MATNLSAASQAQLQSAIDLLVKGSAYETPLSEDVIQRIAPVAQALDVTTVGGAYEVFRDMPYTGLIAMVIFCGDGVLTQAEESALDGAGPNLGGAIGLMVIGTAYETPFAEDVIGRLAPVAASTGFLNTGAFVQAVRDNPVSTMLKWALMLGSRDH